MAAQTIPTVPELGRVYEYGESFMGRIKFFEPPYYMKVESDAIEEDLTDPYGLVYSTEMSAVDALNYFLSQKQLFEKGAIARGRYGIDGANSVENVSNQKVAHAVRNTSRTVDTWRLSGGNNEYYWAGHESPLTFTEFNGPSITLDVGTLGRAAVQEIVESTVHPVIKDQVGATLDQFSRELLYLRK